MNKKRKILIVGPIVFDTIKNKEHYGGTAANIAYGLGILGAKPILFSAVGHDFLDSYRKHLENNKVVLKVHIDKRNKTARYYDFLGSLKKQNVWHPNAHKNITNISMQEFFSKKDLENISFAIFSSNTPQSTFKHMKEFKKYSKNAIIIFDPGTMKKYYTKKYFRKCLNLCNLVILNEFEYIYASKVLGVDMKKFLFNTKKIVIETKGDKGSEVLQNKKKIKIPIVRSKNIVDTTGAGDAYRAGLVFGLWNGKTLEEACKIGARMSSKNVEFLGCQKYKFSL